ncbi:hypothetical protein J4423_01495 [Candidatus Pacearchaeota archaeon]|nr:hypothetical protein [Candidatus Pacearchaeota archaeon]
MNKNNLIFLAFCLFFVALLLSPVNAQRAKYTVHHIDPWTNDNVDSKPGSGVNIVNEDRNPTLADIINGMAARRKMAITLAPGNNSSHSWAVRVVEINLTSYFTNDSENNWTNNFVVIYDPTSHAYYNTTLSAIGNSTNSTAYVFLAGQWIKVIAITMIYKTPPKPGWINSVIRADYLTLPLVEFRKILSYELIHRR